MTTKVQKIRAALRGNEKPRLVRSAKAHPPGAVDRTSGTRHFDSLSAAVSLRFTLASLEPTQTRKSDVAAARPGHKQPRRGCAATSRATGTEARVGGKVLRNQQMVGDRSTASLFFPDLHLFPLRFFLFHLLRFVRCPVKNSGSASYPSPKTERIQNVRIAKQCDGSVSTLSRRSIGCPLRARAVPYLHLRVDRSRRYERSEPVQMPSECHVTLGSNAAT